MSKRKAASSVELPVKKGKASKEEVKELPFANDHDESQQALKKWPRKELPRIDPNKDSISTISLSSNLIVSP